MEFLQDFEPSLEKPILIAALQDMGHVGSITIDFINRNLGTKTFRVAKSSFPTYVLDKGGHIELGEEIWKYRYTNNLIVFGGGVGQPQTNEELHDLCKDVIDVAKKYSVKFIYTLGGFHTQKIIEKEPKTFVTTTSVKLKEHVENLDVDITPQKSVITGFNGLILGYAKMNDIHGMGLYGELNEPSLPQYRAAKSIIKTLEKLTFLKFGDTRDLEMLAEEIDRKIHRNKFFE